MVVESPGDKHHGQYDGIISINIYINCFFTCSLEDLIVFIQLIFPCVCVCVM